MRRSGTLRQLKRRTRRTARAGGNDVLTGALKGAVAGIAGGIAMLAAGELEARGAAGDLGEPVRTMARGPRTRGAQRRRREGAPSRQPAPAIAAQLAAAAVVGAVYGAVQSRVRLPDAAHAAVLGAITLAANASGLLPRGSVLAPPAGASLQEMLMPVGAHALFGTTTARVFGMLA